MPSCSMIYILSWRLWGSQGVSTAGALRQRVQQRLRLLEVGGVKPLGEPAVDGCQQLVGFGPLALLLPEARKAHGGAQLPGFGLLAAGNGEGEDERGLRDGDGAEQRLDVEPIADLDDRLQAVGQAEGVKTLWRHEHGQ